MVSVNNEKQKTTPEEYSPTQDSGSFLKQLRQVTAAMVSWVRLATVWFVLEQNPIQTVQILVSSPYTILRDRCLL